MVQVMNNPKPVSNSRCEGETVFHSIKTNEICSFLRTPVPGQEEPPLSPKTTDHTVYLGVSLMGTFMSLGFIEQISAFFFFHLAFFVVVVAAVVII